MKKTRKVEGHVPTKDIVPKFLAIPVRALGHEQPYSYLF